MNEESNKNIEEKLKVKDFEEALSRIKYNIPKYKLCIILYQLNEKYERIYLDTRQHEKEIKGNNLESFLKIASKELNKSERTIQKFILIGRYLDKKLLPEKNIKAFINGKINDSKILEKIKSFQKNNLSLFSHK